MSEREQHLAARRVALQARCAVQRRDLVHNTQDIERRLYRVDRAVGFVRGAVQRPLLIAAGIGLLALIGPRRLVRLVVRGALALASARRIVRIAQR